jgi:hypothetical protein
VDAATPEPSLQTLLAGLEERLRRHIDSGLAETRSGLAEMRQHIDSGLAETRQYIDAGLAAERRHGDGRAAETRRFIAVLAESLMSKIELVGEGVRTNGEQLERFRADVQDRFTGVDRRVLRLQASRPRRRR